MALLNIERMRRRPRFPSLFSSVLVLMVCLDQRRDAATAQGESDAAKKCEEIKIGELIV